MQRPYAALFTADGVIMQPGAPPAVGREAIEAWARAQLSGWVVDLAGLDLEPVERSGVLAWRRYTGHGHYRATTDGRAVPFDQKYVDGMRREADGNWRFALHMLSSNNADGSIWM